MPSGSHTKEMAERSAYEAVVECNRKAYASMRLVYAELCKADPDIQLCRVRLIESYPGGRNGLIKGSSGESGRHNGRT